MTDALKDKPLFSLSTQEYIDLQRRLFSEQEERIKKLMNSSDNDELLDVDETAEFLKCAKSTVYTLHSKGKLCSNKINGKLYFLKSGLLDLLKLGKENLHFKFSVKLMREV